MCECKNCNNGNSDPIAVAFKDNELPVAQVFIKYGVGELEVTPHGALIGTMMHGNSFATEVAQAAAGGNLSNVTGQERAGLANNILSVLQQAAGMGANIADMFKNKGTNGTLPIFPTTPLPTPQPKAPEPVKTHFGFTVPQLVLLGSALVLIVGALIYTSKKG